MTRQKKKRGAQEPTAFTGSENEWLQLLRVEVEEHEALRKRSKVKFESAYQAEGTIAYGAHECVPVVCPSPPTIASSNIQGHTGTIYYEDTVKYVCVQG